MSEGAKRRKWNVVLLIRILQAYRERDVHRKSPRRCRDRVVIGIDIDKVVVNTETRANAGAAVAENVPGQTDPRIKYVVERLHSSLQHAWVARDQLARR